MGSVQFRVSMSSSSLKNKNSASIYSLSCHSKTVWLVFSFRETQKVNFFSVLSFLAITIYEKLNLEKIQIQTWNTIKTVVVVCNILNLWKPCNRLVSEKDQLFSKQQVFSKIKIKMAKSVESPQFLTPKKYLCLVKFPNSPAIGKKWWHKFLNPVCIL